MADIFISYSKADHALALKLSTFLEAEGWSVWWDKSLGAETNASSSGHKLQLNLAGIRSADRAGSALVGRAGDDAMHYLDYIVFGALIACMFWAGTMALHKAR